MKRFFTLCFLIFFILFAAEVRATNYYISASLGNDTYTAAQAQNPATPWRTITRLNTHFALLFPGDSVLFMRGDTFYGSLIISRSGTAASPIILGAYGSGSKPVITGFQDITGWTALGGNKYEKILVGLPGSLNMVTLDGARQVLGRYPKANAPNGGWLMLQSHLGSTSLTSNAISSAPSFVGGEVVIQKHRWIRDRGRVLTQTANTVTLLPFSYPLDPNFMYSIQNDRGFYFQNHVNALTQHGEWCYDPVTSKITMYLNADPVNYTIKGSIIDNLVDITNRSYIKFDNIRFTGSNRKGFAIRNSSYITLNGCDLYFHGEDGLHNTIAGTNHITLTNCTADYINNNFIHGSFSTFWTIQNCNINHVGDIKGMSLSGDGQANAINYVGSGSVIENNVIRNIGYIGIHFLGSNVLVQRNLVDSFCLAKDDGAGIYTYSADPSSGGGTNRRVLNNIVLNGIGEKEGGGPEADMSQACGIYIDGGAEYVEINNNTIAWCKGSGLHFNGVSNLIVRNNNVYANPFAQLAWNGHSGGSSSGNIIKSNVFFAKSYAAYVGEIYSTSNDMSGWGSIDSNYYCRPSGEPQGVNSTGYSCVPCGPPYHDGGIMLVATPNYRYYSLDTWKTVSGWDANGKKTPFAVPDADIRFEYNATNSPLTISLGANYITVDNTPYLGSITLPPYTSAILLRTSGTPPNQPPVANAGADKNITLPANSVTQTGSGTDPDGTITTYQWTKIAGPAQFNIATASQPTTIINNLVQGVYQFQLQVTDNLGATGRDTVVITVNGAVNQLPVADAGTDKFITLPTNSVTQTGSGSDPDGTIVSYQWNKIAGPAQFTVVSPSQAQTVINNLAQGVYQFTLTVTDNQGATDTDTMVLSVNPAGNQPPVANAGTDKNINLPVNSITQTGSGTDPDGTISSYQWNKVGGPAQFTIVSPNQAQTVINGLAQGTYQFELVVTDNFGLTDTDTMSVTVNPASNQLPTANAGTDKTITLPTNSITQSGSGTDPDGTIVSYRWTKLTGPSQFTIVSPNQAQTVINGLVEGSYQFQLQVTDNLGAVANDAMIITVNRAPLPTTANAGSDQTLSWPIATTTLSGSGTTDPSRSIASYTWSRVTGPAAHTIIAPTQAVSLVDGLLPGVYTFELTVTDNQGGVGKDSVRIELNDAAAVMRVYPNPAGESLNLAIIAPSNIRIDPAVDKLVITIYDSKGSIVQREQLPAQIMINRTIDISKLNKGIYIIETSFSGTLRKTLQFVKH